MKSAKQYIQEYLSDGQVIQLATSDKNVPWVCNVYYVVDDKLHIYWLSYKTRRHSRDIAANEQVAMTLVVKPGAPVIGIQAEGTASEVKSVAKVAKIMYLNVKKYGVGQDFHQLFVRKTNKHVPYVFTPSKIVLFDEQHFG